MRKHDHTNGTSGGGAVAVPPLCAGDRLTRREFLEIWEQHPEIKHAELIGGVVYMPSPLSRMHGVTDTQVSGMLWYYASHTPGTEAGSNTTTLMEGDDTSQPDNFLRILPAYGGQSVNEGKYIGGGPEFLAETSVSSASIDMNQKLELYERMRVQEYLAILMYEQEIRWHRWTPRGFKLVPSGPGMIWKSKIFPGLWLDGKALLANDAARVLATLEKGLSSRVHAAFVKKLARKKK